MIIRIENRWYVQNQYVVHVNHEGKHLELFYSYESLIAIRNRDTERVILDEKLWDYSVTTGKYRNQFLQDGGRRETEKFIKTGVYELANLEHFDLMEMLK